MLCVKGDCSIASFDEQYQCLLVLLSHQRIWGFAHRLGFITSRDVPQNKICSHQLKCMLINSPNLGWNNKCSESIVHCYFRIPDAFSRVNGPSYMTGVFFSAVLLYILHFLLWLSLQKAKVLEMKNNVVMLTELHRQTWYCVRVQSRVDYYNKSSVFSDTHCIRTEGQQLRHTHTRTHTHTHTHTLTLTHTHTHTHTHPSIMSYWRKYV